MYGCRFALGAVAGSGAILQFLLPLLSSFA
jgi:hypothetical protein